MNKLFIILLCSLIFASCGEQEKVSEDGEPIRETMDSGFLDIVCDEASVGVMDSIFKMYDLKYDKVKFSYDTAYARRAMALLLSGEIRAAVIARDYLKDEDSLMQEFDVEKHLRMKLVEDALVFYANIDYPIDTINADEIKEVLLDNKKLTDIYKQINTEPYFVINNQNSSEYANLLTMVTDDQHIRHPYKMFSGVDSVMKYVKDDKNSIGIGYLSHVIGDVNYKVLRVGFYNDSTETHQYPQIVHQAFLLLRKYPFIVTHYVYLLRDKRDLPYWFATYLSKESTAQKYFLDYGLVPTYAKFKLNPQ